MINYFLRHARLLFWLTFTATNFALFTPSVGPKGEFYNLDIIIHYSMFLALASSAFLHWRRIGVVFIVLTIFIPASEFIQENFIPGRGYEFTDIMSGIAGLLSGFLLYSNYSGWKIFSKRSE